jgi:predicted lactoylglutathione lyase
VISARFDQVNVVIADVKAAAAFLDQLGVGIGETEPAWSGHHRAVTAADSFDADLDSSAFARHWGGLPEGFTGVVINLRVDQRSEVDELFERSLSLGAKALHIPYDAFWGSRYGVVEAPGPLYVGLMSQPDATHRFPPPAVEEFT